LSEVSVKRAYDPLSAEDSVRVLVDRLWPRGLPRDGAKIDFWPKKVAPSSALRRWFAYGPASGAVVRRIEDLALVTCFEGGSCLIASACMLQTALREALAAFLAVLDRCTLADLASSPALVRLLETA